MKALVLLESNPDLSKAKLEVREFDTPKPRPGQVLVKMVAAPINPSDDGDWKALRPGPLPEPKRCGNEGSGIVVANGGGLFGWRVLGKKVCVVGANSYSQYCVASAFTNVWSLPEEVPVEDGCSFFINPFTVVGIVDEVLSHGERAFIHTAAASQLGQMMVKYCQAKHVTVVNLVRRQEQVEILQKLGAQHIVDTSKEGWHLHLGALIEQLKLRLLFDAVGGDQTGHILAMLPPKSIAYVYGRLSDQPVGSIQPLDLIYRQKEVKGWLLTSFLLDGGMLMMMRRAIRVSAEVRQHFSTIFRSTFQDTGLENALQDYCKVRTTTGVTGMKMRVRLDKV